MCQRFPVMCPGQPPAFASAARPDLFRGFIIAPMNFLALDIGNTRLKWALYDAPRPGAAVLAQGAEFLEHIERLAEGAWSSVPTPACMLGCVVASEAARRRVRDQMELMPGWHVHPHWVVPGAAQAGVHNGYDLPARLGADRWVAMIGARDRLLRGGGRSQPLLVVMVGTAVTVDALDAQGHFLGGLILPGHGIMLRALESGTAGLHVAVERMYQHLSAHCGGQAPRCIMAGGAGWKMMPSMTRPFELVDNLIFEGLLVLAQQRWGTSQ